MLNTEVMGKSFNFCLLILSLGMLSLSAQAGVIWSDVTTSEAQAKTANNPYRAARRVSADMDALAVTLFSAPLASDGVSARSVSTEPQIELPMPDGSMQWFHVVESPVMEHELARKFPQIKTYKVRSVDDASVSGRLDLGPNGFHGYLHTAEGIIYIDPVRPLGSDQYYSYYKHDYIGGAAQDFSCGARRDSAATSPVDELKSLLRSESQARTSNELLTYRIAVATTFDYSFAVDPVGIDVSDVLAEVITAINRVNEIYERDLAIHLELVANNNLVIYTSEPDPYTNDNPGLLLDQNQTNLDAEIGTANYDIGHVFSTGGGGLAAFEVVCQDGAKARGETGSPNPVDDPFYIDFVAHEIGHQFGADHTFNGTTDSCLGNRWAATAFEPGSGVTIMGYAGICGSENVAALSEDTFHAGSIEQIVGYSRTGAGNTCAITSSPGNTAPVASAGLAYTIPARTAFTLTGSATDTDPLIYQWDQMDAGSATTSSTYGTDLCSNALFRSFSPVSDPSRTFPRLSSLLSGTTDKAETLPTSSRDLNFRLTVRDDNGGVDEDDVVLTVDGNSGPFTVLQPNTALTLETGPGQPQVIEWNSACTQLAPVNCANVDILLSTDSGSTFNSLVGGSTPNDGAESLIIPLTTSSSARIKIACVGNIFFDVSDVDFSLVEDNSGGNLIVTGAGGSSNCNIATDCTAISSGFDLEPNDSPGQAVAIELPLTINGSVNSAVDINDYYSFVAGSTAYVFSLSGYGSNDLDLILYDSSGATVVAESASFLATTETINIGLASGQTYYIVVQGWETSGQDSAYVLSITEKPAVPLGDDGGVTGLWFMLIMLGILYCRLVSNYRRPIH